MRDEASELSLGSATTEHLLIWMLVGTIAHKPLVERSARDRAAACAITLVQRNVRVDVEEQPGTMLAREHALACAPMHAVVGSVLKPTW